MAKVTRERYEKRSSFGPEGRLHIKINVVTTRPMTATEVREKLTDAIRTGVVPSGIEIHWIDWAKEGSAGAVRSGRIRGNLRQALREFYGAVVNGDPRFEVVS